MPLNLRPFRSLSNVFAALRPGLPRIVVWLAIWLAVFSAFRLLPGTAGVLSTVLQLLTGMALLLLLLPLLWQLTQRRLLWSLRNKLVLTYLLIGVAPVVLFVTLVLISSYIAAGQFSIHLVETRVQAKIERLNVKNTGAILHISDHAARNPQGKNSTEALLPQPTSPPVTALLDPREDVAVFVDGRPLSMSETQEHARRPLGLPPWALHLPQASFSGTVLDNGDLFLVSVRQQHLANGQELSVESSIPVTADTMVELAEGIGRAGLIAIMTGSDAAETSSRAPASHTSKHPVTAGGARPDRLRQDIARSSSIFGGIEPPGLNALDFRVRFQSTLPVTDWDTGDPDNIPIEVDSRPSLLYRQLFGGSLSGITTRVIRISLFVLCVLFALIEVLALYMAVRLSRTITASVSDLYQATRSVDRGDLTHRIGVEQDDQLGELGQSFNRMTSSLQRLLMEQQEKERMQNELSIAQEVQANLFPRQNIGLPKLEVHGVCRPARSVSGDYYDFITFHERAHNGQPLGQQTGLGIAIGDISGKGISAALLMATLHSAVRAYRFASEELVFSESAVAGLLANRDAGSSSGTGELFESPGRILALLNRHLYRSTQPEKYATLFLAYYDVASTRLTYSNAGQLPPLVLCREGTTRRLDKGGTVVGLMDGMQYEEDTVALDPGDILIAYSDGVTEPENDFGDFGEERLVEVVERYRNEPLHVISAQVMQALDAWIGAEEQPDDITLVLARQL